jgi:uncharacterized hydrophobic protein (TIGR00271 family)
MSLGLRDRVLPDHQRRTLRELTDDLDLTAGDTRAKTSAFWTMLVLSAVIASAGVLSDSTATVIGAMIIAPLSSPIMGIALGVAKATGRTTRRSAGYVVMGSLVVVAIGVLFSFVVPGDVELLSNPQIAGRTSPGLLDLAAAVATGFAGAIALARRDVAAVLPGVAIAISLVPPLAVVGICVGEGSLGLASGALFLFLSNLLALVLAGSLVFATLGYGVGDTAAPGVSRRKAYLTIGLLLAVVVLPLVANTVFTYVTSVISHRVELAAEAWIAPIPGASVQSVDFASSTVVIDVQTPGELPPTSDLLEDLRDELPDGIPVVVTTNVGQRFELGTVGSG